MPSIQERIVASGRGVRAERDLAQAASDFYVLEPLTARGEPDAARMLSGLEATTHRLASGATGQNYSNGCWPIPPSLAAHRDWSRYITFDGCRPSAQGTI